MVQRNKAADFHDDHRSKPGKRLDFSSQNQGNESKKIMKKSAYIKLSDVDDIRKLEGRNKVIESVNNMEKAKTIELSDFDHLVSLPKSDQMGNLAQPPPSMALKVGLFLSKTRVTPNYMKSTTSSDARKDRKQLATLQTGVNSTCDKNQARRNLKNSKPDPSGIRLARSSSLKLGRTLTYSSSFKQTGSLRKSLPKAATLCSDVHAQKATCSSLLKDSKFPSYVKLNPGGTESEGTSGMKVCTYKYCSLNGHYHASVPPLRSFISERRRSLKNQNSIKLNDATTKPEDGTGIKARAGSDYPVGEGKDYIVDNYHDGKEEGAQLTSDEDGLVGIQKPLDGRNSNLVEENDGAETESEIEKACGNDEERYDSIWEAYEMELQEFEFIDAHLDDHVIVNVSEFNSRSECSFEQSIVVPDCVVEDCDEDELEEGCHENGESFEEKYLENSSDVDGMTEKVETELGTEECDRQYNDLLPSPDDVSVELQASEEIEVAFSYTEDSFDGPISVAEEKEEEEEEEEEEEKIAGCRAEKENLEDDPPVELLIELNGEDDDQKENKDELWENPVTEIEQERIQAYQYECVITGSDVEFETRTTYGAGDNYSVSADNVNGKEDEENVTEKSKRIHELIAPDNAADSIAEGTLFSSDSSEEKMHGVIDAAQGDDENDSTACLEGDNSTSSKSESASLKAEMDSNQELSGTSNLILKITKCKAAEDLDSTKCFNPQEPNYLPLETEPKGEQVDLRHQDIDERRNSEEWMVDYALQKTVNKLAPVKRKKVELLVEAFESVAPTSKRDRLARRTSYPIANIRSIQACN